MKKITVIIFFIISIFSCQKNDTLPKIIPSVATDSIYWNMVIYDEEGAVYGFKEKVRAPITKKDSIDLWNSALEDIRSIRQEAKFH